jgi:hypothetical protein
VEKLSFNLELSEIPVVLKTSDGEEKEYVLREMTGKQRDIFINKLSDNAKYVNGQPQGLKSYDGMHASLLVLVLFDKATDMAVTKDFIQGLPARISNSLFQKAQEMNGLAAGEAETEAVKND